MQSSHQALAELQRRMNNLLHFGVVVECDYEKPAYKVRDGNLTTGWLPTLPWRLKTGDRVSFILSSDGQGLVFGPVAKPEQLTLEAGEVFILGPVTQTGGDMTSDGISAQHHRHGGVRKGIDKTAKPE
jgi:phage baseplate assembly protein gpV